MGPTAKQKAELKTQLTRHFERQQTSFDELVSRTPTSGAKTDVWAGMPTIDSKAIARAAAIFKRVLGIPFTAKAIHRGGYNGVDDVMNRFVPALYKENAKGKKSSKKAS